MGLTDYQIFWTVFSVVDLLIFIIIFVGACLYFRYRRRPVEQVAVIVPAGNAVVLPNIRNMIKTVELKEDSDVATVLIIVAIVLFVITILVIVGCWLCEKKSKKGIMVKTITLTGTETELDDIKINGKK
uniref:Uncharacterized protein n=1 Tax=Strongyloides venezuelensis TaxID=75913 RepID=A0A0K0G368_STRVS